MTSVGVMRLLRNEVNKLRNGVLHIAHSGGTDK